MGELLRRGLKECPDILHTNNLLLGTIIGQDAPDWHINPVDTGYHPQITLLTQVSIPRCPS